MTGVPPAGPGNLPTEPNSFVGRERDLHELALLLGGVHLLTLCGPGGIGKTRLALRLAREVRSRYPDGVWLAGFADATRPAQVARRVSAILGVREEGGRLLPEMLSATLRGRRLLLILDTCEHLAEPCASLAQHLLARCPGLSVIATSREPLRVAGETVWRVPPLELPPPDPAGSPVGPPSGPAVRSLAGPVLSGPAPAPAPAPSAPDAQPWSEAVRLFADRAAAARTGFSVTSENAAAVAGLCRMLDGVPLAIELAAARVRALSVQQIRDRLGDQFQLLTSSDPTAPPRQQTLRAAVDWSHQLLIAPEQVLLRRVSVFSGWTLEMAEEVCAGPGLQARDIPGLLASLVDKSLVTADHAATAGTRYRLLDTIRQYAAARLASSGERTALRLRHRDCMRQFAESIAARAFLRGDPPWPERVGQYRAALAERANFTAALSLSLETGEAQPGLRLCGALRNVWLARGDAATGVRWYDAFLGMPGEIPAALRGTALAQCGELAFERQDYAKAEDCARTGLALCRSTGSPWQATALRVLAQVRMRAGDTEAAIRLAGEAISAARQAGNEWEEGLSLAVRGAVLARGRTPGEAQRSYEAALGILAGNNGWGVARVRYGLGILAHARGDGQAALEQFRTALTLFREIDARPEVARCLAGIGRVALSRADLRLSKDSLAESLRLSLDSGPRLPVARCLEAFAVLAALSGDLPRAVRIAGASLGIRAAAGHPAGPVTGGRLGELLEPARRRLGTAAVSALLAVGHALSADAAAAEALGIVLPEDATAAPHPARAAPAGSAPGPYSPAATRDRAVHHPGRVPDGHNPGGLLPGRLVPGGHDLAGHTPGGRALTPRETEIARLVERGLTNREIAGELVISPATVARHVVNILRKLGFSSRAQIAAWTAAHAPGQPPAGQVTAPEEPA